MILNDLKPLLVADNVTLYEEYGEPIPYEYDCCGIYYHREIETEEMYTKYGDRQIEAIYSEGDVVIIDIGKVDYHVRV